MEFLNILNIVRDIIFKRLHFVKKCPRTSLLGTALSARNMLTLSDVYSNVMYVLECNFIVWAIYSRAFHYCRFWNKAAEFCALLKVKTWDGTEKVLTALLWCQPGALAHAATKRSLDFPLPPQHFRSYPKYAGKALLTTQ